MPGLHRKDLSKAILSLFSFSIALIVSEIGRKVNPAFNALSMLAFRKPAILRLYESHKDISTRSWCSIKKSSLTQVKIGLELDSLTFL
jgi:hypothetical protein